MNPRDLERARFYVERASRKRENVEDDDGDLDEMSSALLMALEHLDGTNRIHALRDADFEAKHPRDAKGRFIALAARLVDALQNWLDGGEGDPFDGFNREQLRRVAKQRGIKLRRGASREEIADALKADLKVKAPKVKEADDPPDPPGVTAARERQAKIDRARSVSGVLVEADFLADNALGTDRDDAIVERLRIESEHRKTPDGVADELIEAFVPDPKTVREVEVDNRIREAYRELAKPGDWVSLADLRKSIGSDVSRREVDAALFKMSLSSYPDESVNVVPESNQKALTQEVKDAAVVIGDQPKHYITMGDPSPRPVPGSREHINATIDSIAERYGLHRVTPPAGGVEKFNPKRHKPLTGWPEGQDVVIDRPAYEADIDGERVLLDKALVVEKSAVDEMEAHWAKVAQKADPDRISSIVSDPAEAAKLVAGSKALADVRGPARRRMAELLVRINNEPGVALGSSEDLDRLISRGLVRVEKGSFGGEAAGRVQLTPTKHYLTDEGHAVIAEAIAAPRTDHSRISSIVSDPNLTPAQKRARLRKLGLSPEQVDGLVPLN